MTKKEQMIAFRNQGMKYRDIAKAFGCSYQYVAKICATYDPSHFRCIYEECVYPNLRKWMNENKVGRGEFLRRMGLDAHPTNYERLKYVIRGESYPRKDYIDKMLEVTGMTYETLFALSDEVTK